MNYIDLFHKIIIGSSPFPVGNFRISTNNIHNSLPVRGAQRWRLIAITGPSICHLGIRIIDLIRPMESSSPGLPTQNSEEPNYYY